MYWQIQHGFKTKTLKKKHEIIEDKITKLF